MLDEEIDHQKLRDYILYLFKDVNKLDVKTGVDEVHKLTNCCFFVEIMFLGNSTEKDIRKILDDNIKSIITNQGVTTQHKFNIYFINKRRDDFYLHYEYNCILAMLEYR